MNGGKGWRCQSEDKTKDWIGIKLDETILELYPQLKNLSFKLWAIPEEDRTQENSPHFNLTINVKQQVKE